MTPEFLTDCIFGLPLVAVVSLAVILSPPLLHVASLGTSKENVLTFTAVRQTSFQVSLSLPLATQRSTDLSYALSVHNTHRYGFPFPNGSTVEVERITLQTNEFSNLQDNMKPFNVTNLEEDYTYRVRVLTCLKRTSGCHGFAAASIRTKMAGKRSGVFCFLFGRCFWSNFSFCMI